jgi:hypothetical protein
VSGRIDAMRACEPEVRSGKSVGSAASRRQQEGGFGMQVCSQPWVTANSRAASREAKVVCDLNTQQ